MLLKLYYNRGVFTKEGTIIVKKFQTLVFLLFISLWGVLSLGGSAAHFVKSVFLRVDRWNAAAVYPFESPKSRGARSSLALEVISRVIEKADNAATTYNPLYQDISIAKKFLDRHLYGYDMTTSISGTGKSELVVKHESGLLSYLITDKDISDPLRKCEEFAQWLEAEGVHNRLAFVPPFKTGPIASSYMGVYTDDARKIFAKISGLRERCWEVVHFTDYADAHGLTESKLFFRTDHHWLPMSGLKGCALVSEWLNSKGFEVDASIFDISNYDVTYWDAPMFGSQGRKVTQVYAEPERLPIVAPRYETDLTVFNSKIKATTAGDIQATLFNYDTFKEKNLYKASYYSFYYYGSNPLFQIHNNQRHDGKRILVIKESQANVMIPYMCNIAEYVDVIDLRHFNGSLRAFIKANKPDCVILVYGASGFSGYDPDKFAMSPLTDPFYFE